MVRQYYSLYDRMLSVKNLYRGYLGVKKAKGAAGIDGQSVADFGQDLERNLAILSEELREKSYRPNPVRSKEIAKPGGVRKLGIPTVRDRIVQIPCCTYYSPYMTRDFIHRATVTGPAEAAIRLYRRQNSS